METESVTQVAKNLAEARKKMQAEMYKYFGVVKVADTGMIQATRSNVKGFKPFRFPRMYDVWFEN